jgi:pectinesterase inhibitor-like protein
MTHHIAKLLEMKNLDPALKGRLDTCYSVYSLAYLELEEAVKGYNTERYNDANTAMSSVSTYATACEDGFKEGKGVVSPLTKRNNEICSCLVWRFRLCGC